MTVRLASLAARFGAALAVSTLLAVSAGAEERLALVIGEADYEFSRDLDTPANDARLVADALETAGFETTLLIDATEIEMEVALRDYVERLDEADGDAVSFVYYAGHGLTAFDQVYLLPVDAEIRRETDVAFAGFNADVVVTFIQGGRPRVGLFVFDAATRAPGAVNAEQPRDGLAPLEAPAGMAILYSAEPGAQIAEPRGAATSGVSPFAEALADAIATPGLGFAAVVHRVRQEMSDAADGRQTPWLSDGLVEDFVFVDALPEAASPAQR